MKLQALLARRVKEKDVSWDRSSKHRSLIARRELTPEHYIPYIRHVDEWTIALTSGAVLRMWGVEGLPYETVDESLRAHHYAALNEVWKGLSDPRIALWHHLLRSVEAMPASLPAGTPFGEALDRAYLGRLADTTLRRNEHIVSLVVLSSRVELTGIRALFADDKPMRAVESRDLELLDEMSARLEAGLKVYRPRRLEAYEDGKVLRSAPAEALHVILTGERRKAAVPMGNLGRSLLDVRPIFGADAIELRGVTERRYAGLLSVGEYPVTVREGMLTELLSAPFDFVLTQSFKPLMKADAFELMTRRQNQMRVAGDKGLAQRDLLTHAASELADNLFSVGEHHLTLLVYGHTPGQLRENVAAGRRVLSGAGFAAKREELSLIDSYFAQLPGNLAFRIRKASGITSRNFAGLTSLYCYPRGQRSGLHWGRPVVEFKTASSGRFAFNFHVRDVGHALILGMSGAGKSTALNFALSGLLKLDAFVVVFDVDRSSEAFVGMQGGHYMTVGAGRPTGAAPFKAVERFTPEYKSFLRALVARLVDVPNQPLTSAELDEVEHAVDAIEIVPRRQRGLAVLGSQLGVGLRGRLARWCAGRELGWAIDCEEDTLGEAVNGRGAPIVGFDLTSLLGSQEAREPVLMYIFEKLREIVGTRRLVWAVEEFHATLADPVIRERVDKALRTWRKANGMAILVSQSPEDAAQSPIAASLIQQTATQLFLPNPKATRQQYIDRFGLSAGEYEVLRRLSLQSRRFLVKQVDTDQPGSVGTGIVCELDLEGQHDVLAVLSPSVERGDFARWDAVKSLPIANRWEAFRRLGGRK